MIPHVSVNYLDNPMYVSPLLTAQSLCILRLLLHSHFGCVTLSLKLVKVEDLCSSPFERTGDSQGNFCACLGLHLQIMTGSVWCSDTGGVVKLFVTSSNQPSSFSLFIILYWMKLMNEKYNPIFWWHVHHSQHSTFNIQVSTRGRQNKKTQSLLSCNRKALRLPDNVPAIHLQFTEYYFPDNPSLSGNMQLSLTTLFVVFLFLFQV